MEKSVVDKSKHSFVIDFWNSSWEQQQLLIRTGKETAHGRKRDRFYDQYFNAFLFEGVDYSPKYRSELRRECLGEKKRRKCVCCE